MMKSTNKHKGNKILLVSGSRDFPDEQLARVILRRYVSQYDILYVGDARGIDAWAAEIGENHCDVITYKAEWSLGKSAGIRRNERMFADVCALRNNKPQPYIRVLILWDGISRGTEHMKDKVELYGLPLTLVVCNYD